MKLSVLFILAVVICGLTCKIDKSNFVRKLKAPKVMPKGFHTMRIYGSDDLKYYYTNIYVGTPPQRQSVIIDTGSDYLAFPCSRCPEGQCGKHNNPQFDLMKDSTAKLVKCHDKIDNFTCNVCNKDGNCSFTKSYLEGSSLFGEVYEDYIRLYAPKDLQTQENARRLPNGLPKSKKPKQELIHKNDLKGAKGTFGCTMTETGLFKTQLANGIMGLSPWTNSKIASPNFVDSLFIDHKVKNRNFSVCLGTNGGYLTFGGYNVNKHIKGEPVQTVPYKAEYHIKFDIPSVGQPNKIFKKALPHTALLDSGTTFTYLLDNVFDPIAAGFNKWCANSKPQKGRACGGKPIFVNSYCVDYTEQEYGTPENFFSAFPKLFFRIANKGELVWFPKDYFELSKKHSEQHMTFCSSFNKENSGSGAFSTFGSLFFRHYDIYFNRSKSTVSFVRSECEDKAVRAYPVRGIKKIVKAARILMGSLISSNYGLTGIFLVMVGLLMVVSMRYGLTDSFVKMFKTAKDTEKEEANKEKTTELVNSGESAKKNDSRKLSCKK